MPNCIAPNSTPRPKTKAGRPGVSAVKIPLRDLQVPGPRFRLVDLPRSKKNTQPADHFPMPELAEVEYFRRQWDPGFGLRVIRVATHLGKRVFRGTDVAALEKELTGARLLGSEGRGKQILFRFSRGASLGIHLGMSSRLRVEAAGISPGKHDHLVLFQKEQSLIYSDPRMFGRIRFAHGRGIPEWWNNLPAAMISPAFTHVVLSETLSRRRRSPIKAVLLDQDLFPGVGNWMADEILWQVKLHPATRAGDLCARRPGRHPDRRRNISHQVGLLIVIDC
jgi:formamidopyrimidine-DNA glycosylase